MFCCCPNQCQRDRLTVNIACLANFSSSSAKFVSVTPNKARHECNDGNLVRLIREKEKDKLKLRILVLCVFFNVYFVLFCNRQRPKDVMISLIQNLYVHVHCSGIMNLF